MSDRVELITKSIAFLTAIAGLYKGAKELLKANNTSNGPFGAFLSIAGVLGSILLFPLFIAALIGIFFLLSRGLNSSDKESNPATSSSRLLIPDSLGDGNLMQDSVLVLWRGAQNVSDYSDRDATLLTSAYWALSSRRFGMAVLQAAAITDYRDRDRGLAEVADSLLRYRNYTLAMTAAGAISDYSARDKKIVYVMRSAERYGFSP